MMPKIRIGFVFVVLAMIANGYCQVPTLEAGSAQAARFLAQQQNRAIESEIEWRAAKKLTLSKLKEPFTKLPSESMSPATMQEGTVGSMQLGSFKVSSIVDQSNCILMLGSTPYWLSNFPTDGLVDGESVRIIDLVMGGPSKTYTTVFGKKATVKSFRMLTPDEEKKIIRDKREALCEDFKLTNGTSIKAKFIDFKKAVITLEDVDGKTLSMKLVEFDTKSAARIRELLKQKSTVANKPTTKK